MVCACGWVACSAAIRFSVSQDPSPGLEFPCRYPVKAMTVSGEAARDQVVSALAAHAEFSEARDVRLRASRNGNFQSITVTLEARSRSHLEALYAELRALDVVKMVL